MDARTFDALARSLRETGSRRGLLALLAAFPLVAGLVALLNEGAAAKGRRKRRKRGTVGGENHKHDHRRRKHKSKHGGQKHKKKHKPKKDCKPEPKTTTCAGKCGPVKNTCKKTVDCGSCACNPPCDICQTCQGEPGACVQDPVGTPCGEPGQVCQDDESCAFDETSCPDCTTCDQDGVCQGCVGCCDEGICVADCPACQTCEDGQCVGCAEAGQICCNDSCVSGVCCADAQCAPNGDACVGHQCTCGGDPACAGAPELCCGGACAVIDTNEDNCGACGNACSGDTPVCWAGECVCGDVCNDVCQFDSVQEAIDELPEGSTIRVCAGAYGAIFLDKDVAVIGVGDGDDPDSNTILSAAGSGRVALIDFGATAGLQGLRITGGIASSGAGVLNQGSLTLTDCTVIGNQSNDAGAGVYNEGSLILNNCNVTDNHAQDGDFGVGGGVANFGTLTLNGASSVNLNIAESSGGGILNSGTVTLNDTSTVADNDGKNGGGIVNQSTCTLNDSSSVTGNETTNNSDGSGGGILNNGTFTLNGNSIVSGNQVSGLLNRGGGIYNTLGSTVNLNDNSRVSGNQAGATATNPGAGVFNQVFQGSSGNINAQSTVSICENTPDQCVGFGAPSGVCRTTC